MPHKKRKGVGVERWQEAESGLMHSFPHLMAWLMAPEEFSELRLKAREDGTVLAIAKGFSADGGPVVCFGVGYDGVLALMAVDATINGGHWKVDKPWQPS